MLMPGMLRLNTGFDPVTKPGMMRYWMPMRVAICVLGIFQSI